MIIQIVWEEKPSQEEEKKSNFQNGKDATQNYENITPFKLNGKIAHGMLALIQIASR